MACSKPDSHAKREVLVFGPQILSFSPDSAATLRSQPDKHFRSVNITTEGAFGDLTNVIASLNDDEKSTSTSDTEEALSSNGTLFSSVSNDHVNQVNGTTNGKTKLAHENGHPVQSNTVHLPAKHVLDTSLHHAKLTDDYISTHGLSGYVDEVVPRLDQLCIAYIRDAFEKLQCEGENITHLPRHEKFVVLLRGLLHQKSQFMESVGPGLPTALLLQDLRKQFPAHRFDYELLELVGGKLAECLDGRADPIQIIFGSPESRDIISGMYGQSPINVVWIRLPAKSHLQTAIHEPLKIFEIGAGTGGTTAKIIPVLLELGVPIENTVTDISSSLVAASRRRFKQYDWVKYRVFDLEKPVSEDILGSQHIALSTNCIHATSNLVDSTSRIRSLLRPDGFLIMLEMTQKLAWIDLTFGLLEGWWQFDDDRDHALAPVSAWKNALTRAGYGRVEWTDGALPEAAIQRLIFATASSGQRSDECDTLVAPSMQSLHCRTPADFQTLQDRETAVDAYKCNFIANIFPHPPFDDFYSSQRPIDGQPPAVVLITGATGSLGSHLVQYLAENPEVTSIICLNRQDSTAADFKQAQALKSRGIHLSPMASSKLRVFQTDTSKPILGLSQSEYEYLCSHVTHIVHSAWPTSITRPIRGFETQFKTMKNLLVLARNASEVLRRRSSSGKITFQFLSSMAVVGLDPLRSGQPRVLEEHMPVASVLPNGHGDAKLVCERMLINTLGRYPNIFRSMTVRLGQIAGSRATGYWNPDDHFSFVVKSAQALGALPVLEGTLSWCPVTDCAASVSTLLLSTTATHDTYHIENPIRQPWPVMIEYLRKAMQIPRTHVIPFDEWVARLRRDLATTSAGTNGNNSTWHHIEFLEAHLVRISCGGVILDATKSMEDSKLLRNMRPVDEDLVKKYVQSWKDIGFLE
ncbi:polyketide synthase [Pestalotiopsis sp. NC0098]|nr:polyketide synthase [Pestalotiopsis sp. NC0098]